MITRPYNFYPLHPSLGVYRGIHYFLIIAPLCKSRGYTGFALSVLLLFCYSVIIFVSAQYLENQWTEFNQILYTH